MALWAYIPAAEIVTIGPLPHSAVRHDTGREVSDVRKWAVACRWWDLDDFDLDLLASTNGLSTADRINLEAAVAGELAKRGRRDQAIVRLRSAAGLARSTFWDWLDDNAHSDLLPLISGQSPLAGQAWPAQTTAQKAEELRRGVSWAALWSIRSADAFVLLADVLADAIRLADVDSADA